MDWWVFYLFLANVVAFNVVVVVVVIVINAAVSAAAAVDADADAAAEPKEMMEQRIYPFIRTHARNTSVFSSLSQCPSE